MEVELRIVLLVIGSVILLVLLYDLHRRRQLVNSNRSPASFKQTRMQIAPRLDDYAEELMSYEPEIAEVVQQPYVAPHFDPQEVITISVMARDQRGFHGAKLLEAFTAANLHFGKNDIFYRYADGKIADDNAEILFSVATAVEPGFFIYETLSGEYIPGVILILLPDKLSDVEDSFDKFVRTAKQIAFALNGELLDHDRKPLTLATIDQYRKNILRL